MSHPAAWQPDPTGRHDHRWWDGERWTEHVADAGQASTDPLDRDPPPPSGDATPPTERDASAGDLSPGGWAQGASEQGRDPDAPGGQTPVWSQPGGGDQGGAGSQPGGGYGEQGGGYGGQQPGAPAWQSGGGQDPAWGGGQDPAWGGGQGGGQGGAGQGGPGDAPVWQQGAQPGGAWQGGGSSRTDGVAVAALVVGILAILVSWIPVLGAIGGIVALVLGIVGRSRIKKSGASGNGMAVTGIATGAVSIAINIAIIAFFLVAGGGFFDEFGSYVECVEETGDEELCQQQLEEGLFQRFGQ